MKTIEKAGVCIMSGAVGLGLYRYASARVPSEGQTRCVGYELQEYRNGEWTTVEQNSSECGFVCAPGDTKCVGYKLQECREGEWVVVEEKSARCGWTPEVWTIAGRVVDFCTKQAVPVVHGEVVETGDSADADGSGLIVIHDVVALPGDTLTLHLTREGYEDKDVRVALETPSAVDVGVVEMQPLEPCEEEEPRVAGSITKIFLHAHRWTDQTYYSEPPVVIPETNWYQHCWHFHNESEVPGEIRIEATLTHPDGRTRDLGSADSHVRAGQSRNIATPGIRTENLEEGTYQVEGRAYYNDQHVDTAVFDYEVVYMNQHQWGCYVLYTGPWDDVGYANHPIAASVVLRNEADIRFGPSDGVVGYTLVPADRYVVTVTIQEGPAKGVSGQWEYNLLPGQKTHPIFHYDLYDETWK